MQIFLVADFHPDHNAYVEKALKDWGKLTNTPVEISSIDGFIAGGNIYDKLQAVTKAGDPPDLINHNSLSGFRLSKLGLAEDVTDVVTAMTKNYGKVFPGMVARFQVEGKWTAVPFHGRASGYYVRADLAKKAGLDVEKDFATFDKAREASLKMSDPDAQVPVWGWGMTVNHCGDGETMVWNMIQNFGGFLTDETGQVVKLNSPGTIAGMTWLKETYSDPKWAKMLPPGVNTWTDPSNNEQFLAGKIAFTNNAGTMYAKGVLDKVPFAKDIQLIENLTGPFGKKLQGGNGASFYLIKGLKQRDQSVALVQHMLKLEVQRELWKISQGYVVPPYFNLWEEPLVKDDRNNQVFGKIAWTEPPFLNEATPGPLSAAIDGIQKETVATDMAADVLKGMPVADAVKKAHDRSVKIYKDFGLKGE
jgi:multiple sugar transport system substrate-binding protein